MTLVLDSVKVSILAWEARDSRLNSEPDNNFSFASIAKRILMPE